MSTKQKHLDPGVFPLTRRTFLSSRYAKGSKAFRIDSIVVVGFTFFIIIAEKRHTHTWYLNSYCLWTLDRMKVFILLLSLKITPDFSKLWEWLWFPRASACSSLSSCRSCWSICCCHASGVRSEFRCHWLVFGSESFWLVFCSSEESSGLGIGGSGSWGMLWSAS